MNYTQVKELIGIIDSSHLTEFQLTMDNVAVAMSKLDRPMSSGQSDNVAAHAPKAPAAMSTHNADTHSEETNTEKQPEAVAEAPVAGGEIVKAPIVGTFYAAPGAGKPDFVKVGAQVKTGDVLCILEAMKIMNEIVSPCDGQVVEIYAKNEALVEYGQPLLRILP